MGVVLNASRSSVDRHGLGTLRLVRVLRARVDLELAEHGSSELGLGQHAPNRLFDDACRVLLAHVSGRGALETAEVAAVATVELVGSPYARSGARGPR